jgi:hypothetical protein
MHKVKGIEYDAVIIPASLSKLPSASVADDKIKEGIDEFTMYWSESNFGMKSSEYIRDNVKVGRHVFLNKEMEALTFWYVIHNNQKIAQLSKAMVGKLNDLEILSGFVVSSVYVNTYNDTNLSDKKTAHHIQIIGIKHQKKEVIFI